MNRLISILLAFGTLLSGLFSGGGEAAEPREYTAFSDMEYTRPDMDGLERDFDAALEKLEGFCTYRELTALLDKCYEDDYNFETMFTLADIRSCQDQSDEYYAQEYMWCADCSARIRQRFDELYYACAASRFANRLERSYFWEGFREEYSNAEDSKYSEESVALMQQESALISEYRTVSADPVIELGGKSYSLGEYLEYADDEEYLTALDAFYEKYNPIIADIYIRLVKVRRALAESMGYDSYEQMQYEYFFERDYTPAQAEEYFETVRSFMLPIYYEIYQGEGYLEPWYSPMSQTELESALAAAAESMGGSVEEAYDYMVKCDLRDIERRPNKIAMSFQTYIDGYDAPFLFLDPAGDISDLLNYSHEFGHYLDCYVNYNAYETTDLSESYSQSMELLTLERLAGILDEEELERLYTIKALDLLDMYLQQSSFAEFEQRVYAAEESELDTAFLNSLSLEMAVKYGYYDGYNRDYYAMSWIDIPHFFEQPFYVVSYPVSNDIAMQIYALELEEPGAGLAKLAEMIPRQSQYMMESAELAGLESPFAPGRVEKAAAALRDMLFAGQELEAAA